jgi:hypothetical protein
MSESSVTNASTADSDSDESWKKPPTISDVEKRVFDEIEALRDRLEVLTGEMYKITIDRYGTSVLQSINEGHLVVLEGKNKSELPVEVYDMEPNFKELEARYDNYGAMWKKISELRHRDVFIETKICDDQTNSYFYGKVIGKCGGCNSYGKLYCNSYAKGTSYNIISNDICQNCSKWFESKWSSVKIFNTGPDIYTGGGGRMSILTPIGKYKFIR